MSVAFANQNDHARAVGKIPSGIFVVSSELKTGQYAFIASWVQQVSFNPLLIALAFSKDRNQLTELLESGNLRLHILGQNSKSLIGKISKLAIPDLVKLGYIELAASLHPQSNDPYQNMGIIIPSALATMDLKIISQVQPGDHVVVFAEVRSHLLLQSNDQPLFHTRASGYTY